MWVCLLSQKWGSLWIFCRLMFLAQCFIVLGIEIDVKLWGSKELMKSLILRELINFHCAAPYYCVFLLEPAFCLSRLFCYLVQDCLIWAQKLGYCLLTCLLVGSGPDRVKPDCKKNCHQEHLIFPKWKLIENKLRINNNEREMRLRFSKARFFMDYLLPCVFA